MPLSHIKTHTHTQDKGIFEKHVVIPTDVEPFTVVIVDSDVVVTQQRQADQRGYQ